MTESWFLTGRCFQFQFQFVQSESWCEWMIAEMAALHDPADGPGSRVPNNCVVIAFVQVNWQIRQRDAGHSPAKVTAAVPRVRLKMGVCVCSAEKMHHHALQRLCLWAWMIRTIHCE